MIGKEILNYTIVSFIGKGGMGSVYLAEHKYIQQQKVAVKVINKDMVNDYTLKLLKEEAEHLASLNHQNIVHFHDYHVDEEGNIYLIMEYADGVSLDNYIRSISGLIVEEKICPLFEPLLDAVGYAHKHNIIHRDIKPANIIITKESIPKILDFGIATLLQKNDSEEEERMIVGTPSYMSPEQVRGEKLDFRSDIYSLGVLLHQMLTGNAPYDTTTLTEHDINKKVVEEPLPRLRTYYKYVSDKVQKVVDKATSKDPEKRYQTCADFKRALHQAIYPPKLSKWTWISATIIVLLLLGGGFWWWDYHRVKISYYKDYTERWGIPQGIGKLSPGEVKHMHRCYRFEYQKYKLQRMSHVNSRGHIIEDGESERNERPLDMLLYYRENGKISSAKILDRNGKTLYVKAYNDKLNTVVFQYNDEYGTEKTIGAQTVGYVRAFDDNSVEKGKISRWLLEYDENGYVRIIRYAGFQNVLVGDAHNIYGRKYVRDEKGRVVEEHYLAFDGSPKATKWGLGIKKFYYDGNDNWVKTQYLTVDRKPAYDDADGLSVYVMEYDKHGNVEYALHQDADGELMLPKNYGIAGVRYVYDTEGFPIETEYLGTDRKLCYVPANGFAKVRDEYDDNGYVIKKSFYDINDEACFSSKGMASISYVNDDKGNNLEMWFYGTDGELYETKEGNAGVKFNYDSVGNITERIAYGADKKVCLTSDGTAGYKAEYNAMYLLTKYICLGTDLLPCKDCNGIFILVNEYDKRGNRIKLSFYDASGEKLIRSDEDVAGWNSVYDDKGNEIERNFFDEKEQSCMLPGCCAKWISNYDEQGNEISIRYYDVQGNLTLYEGRVGIDYVRDERGNILEEKAIGPDGKLAKGKLIVRYKYDKYDNEIELALFKNDKPETNAYGFHKYVCVYNERNQQIEKRYYDVYGKLTLYNEDKYAIQKDEYDEKGNNVRRSYYGKNEQAVVCNEGYASLISEYDALGHIVRQSYVDTKGNPTDPKIMVPEGFCKYDKWGNMVYLASGDGKGNLIMNPQTGWCILRSEYNAKGQVVAKSFFNEKDKPMMCKEEGCHKITYEYDKSGNETVVARYGIDNKPVLVNGYHKETYVYNKQGKWIENALFGKKGEKVNCDGGFHKTIVIYDEEGTALFQKYFQLDGSLLGIQKWDGTKWVVESNTVSSWQRNIRNLNAELPLDLGENVNHLIAESIQVINSNVCQLIFKTSKSRYEMAESELKGYSDFIMNFVTKFKSENLPSQVILTAILLDAKGRNLATVKR